MPTELLLAPVGAGKTTWALEQLVETTRRDAFARIWVLLPGRRQEDAFRQRLIDYQSEQQSASRVYFNVEFFSFYTLYARLLDIAGIPQRELEAAARVRLLREILIDMQAANQLEVYGKIADKAGFAEIVASFIYELKQNVIQPSFFEINAQTGKDRDLSRIYSAYQDKLTQHHLVDVEGEGWLALHVMQDPDKEYPGSEKIATSVDLLLVDGFDHFNLLQARLLALLTVRTRRAIIALPTVPGRENTIGRRFREALNRLLSEHEKIGQSVVRVTAPPPQRPVRHVCLQHILDNSFRSAVPKRASDGCLTLLEAPDPAAEVASVLRRVKRLLLDGCPPDEILIAVRDWPRYSGLFAALGRAYGLPLSLHYGEPLAENPALITLLDLLDLAAGGFRRREVLDVLYSPYFQVDGLAGAALELLERISVERLVVAGRDEWLAAIEQAARPSPRGDEAKELLQITPEVAAELYARLSAFFDTVTPPAQAQIIDYVRWLENLIGPDLLADPDDEADLLPGGLRMLPRLRTTTEDQAIIDRDLHALQMFKRVLRNFLAAQNLFAALGLVDKAAQEWPRFFADLRTALGSAAINRDSNRAGKVLVTLVTDARGLPHRHVFIPGLSEGVFPAPVAEDPLYLDSERAALAAAGVALETSAERAADEGLFYEIISQARDSLTLSRPTVQNGAIWPESHLWRAVRDLFDDAAQVIETHRVRLGGVVAPDDAASRGEAALAVAAALEDERKLPDAVGLYNWLVTADAPYWSRVRLGRSIDLNRIAGVGDHYAGRLHDARLVEQIARDLGPARRWSATQFSDYGMCGFRFFAKRLLKLEALEEPEEGMDAAQRGTIIHAILEETYRRLTGVQIMPENMDTALATLRTVADEILPNAPARYGFRASPLWTQESAVLLRKLMKLVALDFSGENPLTKKFGAEARRAFQLEMPFSIDGAPFLELDIPAAGRLRVTGKIDRIDLVEDRAVIIDYKSGSTEIPTKEMTRGRNFQMMLYLLASRRVLKAEFGESVRVAGGIFWHVQNQKASGQFDWDEPDDQAALDDALEKLGKNIQRGREGDFTVEPNKLEEGRCARYCEFSQFCRVSLSGRR